MNARPSGHRAQAPLSIGLITLRGGDHLRLSRGRIGGCRLGNRVCGWIGIRSFDSSSRRAVLVGRQDRRQQTEDHDAHENHDDETHHGEPDPAEHGADVEEHP
jgi:hypothetical protein